MTHSLTPHEQQQVDEAAFKEAKLHFHPRYSADQNYACQLNFKAGITFALQHLLPGRMEAEATRAEGLVEKLEWLEGWVSDRHGSDNPISEDIREALNNYNNSK